MQVELYCPDPWEQLREMYENSEEFESQTTDSQRNSRVIPRISTTNTRGYQEHFSPHDYDNSPIT